jgi:hypothetical protein
MGESGVPLPRPLTEISLNGGVLWGKCWRSGVGVGVSFVTSVVQSPRALALGPKVQRI